MKISKVSDFRILSRTLGGMIVCRFQIRKAKLMKSLFDREFNL